MWTPAAYSLVFIGIARVVRTDTPCTAARISVVVYYAHAQVCNAYVAVAIVAQTMQRFLSRSGVPRGSCALERGEGALAKEPAGREGDVRASGAQHESMVRSIRGNDPGGAPCAEEAREVVPGVAVAPWAIEPGETHMSREPRGEDVAVVGAGAASQSGVIPRAHEDDAERIVDVELSSQDSEEVPAGKKTFRSSHVEPPRKSRAQ